MRYSISMHVYNNDKDEFVEIIWSDDLLAIAKMYKKIVDFYFSITPMTDCDNRICEFMVYDYEAKSWVWQYEIDEILSNTTL